jgi:outer membrane protein assembly complex protein YaeT
MWSLLVVAAAMATACQDEGTIQVHKLTFKGVKGVSESQLSKALATQPNSKLPWGKKHYFDRSRFETDLTRIKAFYADRGYPDARIASFDLKLNKTQDAVDLTVTIVEGQPVIVAAVNFVGFDTVPSAHLHTLTTATPLKIGHPRDRQLVVATQQMALNELRDHGYPYAQVLIDEQDEGQDGTGGAVGSGNKKANLTFRAVPRTLAHFGPVAITGNKSVSDRIIERELAYKPGDLYQRSLVQDTQRRLYGMELFQFASVEPQNVDDQPEEVPTRVSVAEGNHQRTNFGVGYGTEEKGRVDADYHHLNFLGGARSAGVHVRWSSLDRGLRLDLTQPYFFAPHLSVGAQAQDWYTYTPAYRSVVVGGKVLLTHRSSAATSWSVSLTSERDSSSIAANVLGDSSLRNDLISLGLDPSTGEQHGTLNSLGFDLQHSTADNALNAHRGYQVAFHTEQAGRILPGTFKYWSVSADARHYLPIGPTLVWANRVQAGNLDPAGGNQANVPFAKKYFLGGATSIRGWGLYEVSPLSGSGLPVGGDSMLAFSSELRAVLSGNFGGVLFLDGGNVWANPWGVQLHDLLYAVGPGLRYQTPIGPIRFDVGYQLNRLEGLVVNGAPETRRWRIHFSIGQAF